MTSQVAKYLPRHKRRSSGASWAIKFLLGKLRELIGGPL